MWGMNNNGEIDKLLQQTTNFISIKRTVEGNNFIFLPVVISSLSYNWDNDENHSFVKTVKTEQPMDKVDRFGNSLKSMVLTDPNKLDISIPDNSYDFKTTSTSEYETAYDENNWLINRPTQITIHKYNVANSAYGDKIMRTKFEYYNSPSDAGYTLLKSKTVIPEATDPNLENHYHSFTTKMQYEYDLYGHITKQTLSAPNFDPPLANRVTEYKYDASDEYHNGYNARFLTRIIHKAEPADYVTRFVYSPITDNKEKQIDPAGLITSYQYGPFNKLHLVTYPDGTTTTYEVDWADGVTDAPANALYFTSQIHTDEPAATAYMDKFQREIRSVSVNPDGDKVFVDKEYNNKGQLSTVTEPYFSTQLPDQEHSTYFSYDEIGRLIEKTTPTNAFTYIFNGRTSKTINNGTGITVIQTVDAVGNLKSKTDPAGVITYNYFSSGKVKNINALGAITEIEYDPLGKQVKLTDPDAGITVYTYNAFGELTYQKDAKGNEYKMIYDDYLGKLIKKECLNSNKLTEYVYQEDPDKNGFGQLEYENYSNDISYHYLFDNLGRIIQKEENIQGKDYISSYEFNETTGKLEGYTYPHPMTEAPLLHIGYFYNNGYLTKIQDINRNKELWHLDHMNKRGQITDFSLGNGLSTHKGFDDYGFPKSIITGSVQDLEYQFNPVTGNLNWRKDHTGTLNLTETFGYDELLQARLKTWHVTGLNICMSAYRKNGNIYSKTGVTTINYPLSVYKYGQNAGPHAVTGIDHPADDYLNVADKQTIEYTSFNKIRRIDQYARDKASGGHDYTYGIEYGPEHNRKISVFYKDYRINKIKYYVGGNYEEEVDAAGNKRKLHYLSGPTGLFAIFVQNGDADTMYYVQKDYLGSYYCITDERGGVAVSANGIKQIYSFDPWGRRRNYKDWSYTGAPDSYLFDRGFTGHQHLDAFGLINMNGRVYDPRLARFLSPDNFVQSPDYSQNFNRYSYALNNPLKYTDPDGEFFVLDSWVRGFIHGFFSTSSGRLSAAWHSANHRAGNDAKIWGGLFATDPNKTFGGKVWEVISRFTWQAPQTVGGFLTSHSYNTFGLLGGVESVDYKYGATVVKTRNGGWGAITQGSYIVGDNSIETDANNPLFQHEYGHYIQSQSMGWAFYPRVGIPSILSKGDHNLHPVEQDANRRAFLYFNKNVEEFYDVVGGEDRGWDWYRNPIGGYGKIWDYKNSFDLQTIDKLIVKPKWYDYVFPIVSGFYNAYQYNR